MVDNTKIRNTDEMMKYYYGFGKILPKEVILISITVVKITASTDSIGISVPEMTFNRSFVTWR